ncbi:DUF3265 domain-containing protein [Vibrio parahaemolyticus]|nr:DUF3265 domain-containing protein [Vibrio parahaemolyticus]
MCKSFLHPHRRCLTICLRVIRNAWHFYYALVLVIKVVAETSVLRCSHLNRALCLLVIQRLKVLRL